MDKITKKLRGCAWQQLERVEGETRGGRVCENENGGPGTGGRE